MRADSTINDTIFAMATPPGISGVAVLRISGPAVAAAAAALGTTLPQPRMAALRALKSKSGVLLDKALLLYFPAPHSFTGEDVLELHVHGSRAIREAVMAELLALPQVRLAEAGEFTRRAFAHGKMDILEAEGLLDVIAADTGRQLQQAWRQAGGQLSQQVALLRDEIIRPMALMEAFIDFPEEEIPPAVLAESKALREVLIGKIESLLVQPPIGEKLREGMEVVILGAPNAGKSSLINALTRRDVAIVSAQAGTTRDMLEAQLEICGFPVTLIDTAGLREAESDIEKIGIEKAKNRTESADLVIVLYENDSDAELLSAELVKMQKTTLFCHNKSDRPNFAKTRPDAIAISAKTGDGLPDLIAALTDHIEGFAGSAPSPLITRARHRGHFQTALMELKAIDDALPLELVCEHYRRAALAIGNITGKIHHDELLDLIFREFCIGK